MKNIKTLFILQYNVQNNQVKTMISLLADSKMQDYDIYSRTQAMAKLQCTNHFELVLKWFSPFIQTRKKYTSCYVPVMKLSNFTNYTPFVYENIHGFVKY